MLYGREKSQQERISCLAKILRNSYYKFHGNEILDMDEVIAAGGSVTESIGPWPEYNIRGVHCKRSVAGLCTPCFYSRFPLKTKSFSNETVDYRLIINKQIDRIINSSANLIDGQIGHVAYDLGTLFYSDEKPLAMCLTPVGSFFDEDEFYPECREYLLDSLISLSNSLGKDIILYVEAHVVDFLTFFKVDRSITIDKLRKLHLRIVFGFESASEYVRNVLYNKYLAIKSFKGAVKLAKQTGFGVYAFVFAGLPPMTDQEIIQDVQKTLLTLKELGVIPVMMFGNIQDFTIPKMLFDQDRFRFPNPMTVLAILKSLIDIFGCEDQEGLDSWLIADPVGGPPTPAFHIFQQDEGSGVCERCCSLIYDSLLSLRRTRCRRDFDIAFNHVTNCTRCLSTWQVVHKKSEDTPIIDRAETMIDFCETTIHDYISECMRNEILEAKAGLLCYGARANDEMLEYLSSSKIMLGNDFVHSSNLILMGTPANVCIKQKFCVESPYELRKSGDKIELRCKGDLVCDVSFIEIPVWGTEEVEGYRISDFLRPHSKNCLSIWPNGKCMFTGHKQCRFCSLSDCTLTPSIAAQMVLRALECDPYYSINISGGVYKSFKKNIDYICDIVKQIRKKSATSISVETIPPRSKDEMRKIKESGVTSILMNLEIFRADERRNICPGKSIISNDEYFSAFAYGVEIFGRWKVASVLIFGLQRTCDILEAASQLISLGVMPIIMPFQPIDGIDASLNYHEEFLNMRQGDFSFRNSYIETTRTVSKMLEKERNEVMSRLEGCSGCGACSIERQV